jgi:membrane-associated protease RseP (regulator of RpoE activity)
MMRRSDDVFFFTLIDFLLQVFFFGLLLFVVAQTLRSEEEGNREKEIAERDKLLKTTGVSSLTELTDMLTKMVPLDQLRGDSEFIARNGGQEAVAEAVKASNSAGGAQKVNEMQGQVEAMSKRLAQLEGWGKVSCIPNIVVNGKLQPKSIATVVVTDDGISLEDPQPEMEGLLQRHGLDFSAVQRLSLPEFRRTFAPVVSKQPECRYFLNVVTRTRYLDPMRAVWSAFRTQ